MKKQKENKSAAKRKAYIFGITAALAAAAGLGLVLLKSDRGQNVSTDVFYSMDTTVSIKLWGEKNDSYRTVVEKLDGLFDCYDENSEIYALNSNGKAVLSGETLELLRKAKELCEKYPECDITAGELIDLWDVNGDGRIPQGGEISQAMEQTGIKFLEINGDTAVLKSGKINLGCCAKGYACDVLKNKLKENGEECAVVSFGSSSLLYGKKPDGEKFSVEILNPLDKNTAVGKIKTDECFVSTSGGYERYFEADGKNYSHIFDLKTGRPVQTDLLSVTVFSQSGIETDFLSTCIYIKGTSGLDEFLKSNDFSVIAIDENKNIYISENLKDSFTLSHKDFKIVN